MPDGSPIDQWWKSHRPPTTATTAAKRVCGTPVGVVRRFCGRRKGPTTVMIAGVTCSECLAALAADDEIRGQSDVG